MKRRFTLLLILLILASCESIINKSQSASNELDNINGRNEKITYLQFDPAKLDGFKLDDFDINGVYKIDSNNLILIAYSDGDLETSENPSNWGDRLILMKGESIVFQSKPVGDPYKYEPYFYKNSVNDKVVIICQLGNEENYGGEAFLLENGNIEFIGEINIENPKETPNTNSLIEMIRISEVENAIYFNFDSDTLIDLRNDDWKRVKNNSIHYVYKGHKFKLKGL